MDAMKGLLEEFDFAKFLPALDSVLGWIELAARICVMAGPVLLLGFGLLYLLAPPKEANHRLGYRCWWGMASLDAWQFTQHVAGMVWTVLGTGLTIIMALICNGFRGLSLDVMVTNAVTCILWELGLTAASCIGTEIAVIIVFDKDGYRRREA